MELTWHDPGSRLYETGVFNVAFYIQNPNGTYARGKAWNGVISVTASPSGGEASPIIANNMKIGDTLSATDFGGRIEAFTRPDDFCLCDGIGTATAGIEVAMQKRRRFGLVYKTLLGNDIDDLDHGYKLHIYYGCRAQPAGQNYGTMNENADILHYSWNFTSIPVISQNFPPLSYICIDTTKIPPGIKTRLQHELFGYRVSYNPNLLLPDKIYSILTR